jgi:hypothetical protein
MKFQKGKQEELTPARLGPSHIRTVHEDNCKLGCDAVQFRRWTAMFRGTRLPPSSRSVLQLSCNAHCLRHRQTRRFVLGRRAQQPSSHKATRLPAVTGRSKVRQQRSPYTATVTRLRTGWGRWAFLFSRPALGPT